MLTADAFANLALGMLGPIYAIFVQKIGGDILDASWAYFTFTITCGVTIYLIGRWEDHQKHKEKLIVVGYSLTAVGALGYIFVDSQASLVVVQIVLGLATAILSPAFDALYSRYVTKGRETSNWGAWEGMGYVVTAVAAIVGGYIASTFGFTVLFISMFISALAGAITSFGLFNNRKYLNNDN